MTQEDLLITNAVIYTNGTFLKGSVGINQGVITEITSQPDFKKYKEVKDIQGHYLLPGAIESHMHVREPGRPDRGTFLTETQAAAAGGVTTILEHPIANPPQYNEAILACRQQDAQGQCVIDYAFYGAAGAEFPAEVAKMGKTGIVAFKTFLHQAPEGRDSEFIGLTMADDGEMYTGFREVAKTGKLSAVHAENNDIIQSLIKQYRSKGKTQPIYHCKSRPKYAEYETVAKLLLLAKDTGNKFIFCHVSTPEAMQMIKEAKAEGLEVYAETCPHYLYFNEEALTKYGAYAKCNPPLRPQEDIEKLWSYVSDGTIDFIGSDHATYTVEEKEKSSEDIFTAPAGFIGVDMRVPLMLNAVNEGKLTLAQTVDLLSGNIAKTYGLYPKKGVINIGSDADFMVVDLKEEFTVDMNQSYSKAKAIGKIYNGLSLKGRPIMTIVRGKIVMENGQVFEDTAGWGELVEVYQTSDEKRGREFD